jgi:chorismate mutase/prephenate dehydratase
MVRDSGDKSLAAIAGEVNASLYGLEVLKSHIQNEKNNQTRFFVLSRKKIYKKDSDKISICFELPNKEGALYRILSHFAFNSVNMSRIESRPIPSKPFEYRFFVDVEGHLMDEGMQNALLGLSEEASNLRILGHYR